MFIVLLLICTACTNANTNANLDNLFASLPNIENYNTNNNLKYYSYYLPSDLGEEEIASDSVNLKYGESTIIMNLNIADIINSSYYADKVLSDDGFYNNDYLIYENSGTYTLKDESEKSYLYKLYDYDEYYALYLKTSDNIFYGNVVKGSEKEVTRQLLIIAKSVDVDENLVIADYSSKDTIDYQKKQIDLFNYQKPSNGTLGEMLTDDATVGDGENTNENVDNNENNIDENQNTEQSSNQLIDQETEAQ